MTLLMIMSLLGSNWLKKDNNLKVESYLSNIEALASYENGKNVICFDVGSLDCPADHTKVLIIYEF